MTTDVFQRLVGGLPSVRQLKDQSPSNHAALERASAKARKAILAIQFPEPVTEEIVAAHGTLSRKAVSARSSSTAEDLEEASFAGQYDSFLNIRTVDDLLDRVKDVWVSLYSPHAVGYRRRHGIPFDRASMAVVVQRQLEPEAAGVLFTKNPVSGKRQYVVTAALGLGEGVAAGSVETDRYVLQPSTGKVLASEIASKTVRVESTDSGGVETVTIPGDRADKPAVTTRQLRTLAGYGRKLVRLGKGPQDIEFAVQDGKVQILQARAMTAVEEEVEPEVPWDAHVDRRYTWHRSRGSLSRLEQDAARLRNDQMRVCHEETGSSMTRNHIVCFANGYMFTRPFRHDPKTLDDLHARQRRRVDRWEKEGKSYFEGALRGLIEDRLRGLKRHRAGIRSLTDRVSYLEACMQMAAWVQGNLHWRQGRPGRRGRSGGGWPETFQEITGEPRLNAYVYTSGVQSRMTRLIDRIRELARIAQEDRVLKRLMLDRRWDDLWAPRIARRRTGGLFMSRFRSMMQIYGQRNGSGYGSANSFTTPTWNIDPSIPLELIATYVEQDLDRLDRIEQETRNTRIRATRQMQRKLADDVAKLKRFNKALKRAVIGVRFLEDHNYYMEQCSTGTMREAIHEVGMTLVALGLIERPDDVVHFSLEELKHLAALARPGEQRALVRERKRKREQALRGRMNPPEAIGRSPKVPKNRGSVEKRGRDGSVIKGDAASAGRATGPAVVVQRGKPHPKVHPGDILVASNVGPDWTPTFAVIGGLVLDGGSMGQHAALVAREYRVPAVLSTQEASTVIGHGQIITVDGDRGLVELEP